jgi:hypothetical protein
VLRGVCIWDKYAAVKGRGGSLYDHRSSSASLFNARGTYSGISPCLHRELPTLTKWHSYTILCKNSWKLIHSAFKHVLQRIHIVIKFILKIEAVTCIILSWRGVVMQRLYTLLSWSLHRNEKSPYYRSGALGAQSPSLIILFPYTLHVTPMDVLWHTNVPVVSLELEDRRGRDWMYHSHTDLSTQFVEYTVYQACDLCTFIHASNGTMTLLLHICMFCIFTWPLRSYDDHFGSNYIM